MSPRASAGLALTLFVWSCSAPPVAGPPEVAYGEIECGHCRMIVSEVRYAAAVRGRDGETRVFDDLSCLVSWSRGHDSELETVWVHDVDDLSWLRAESAVYAYEPGRITPMGSGLIARANKAEAAAAEVGEYSWPELLAGWEAPVEHNLVSRFLEEETRR